MSPGIDGQPTFTIVETAASPSYAGNGFEIRCKDAFSLVFALRDFLFTGIKNNPSDLNMVNSSPSVTHGVDRRTDEYHPMSTQFLLFVPDNKKHGEPSLTTENPPLAAPIEADASNLLVEDSNAITIERWYRGCMGRARCDIIDLFYMEKKSCMLLMLTIMPATLFSLSLQVVETSPGSG